MFFSCRNVEKRWTCCQQKHWCSCCWGWNLCNTVNKWFTIQSFCASDSIFLAYHPSSRLGGGLWWLHKCLPVGSHPNRGLSVWMLTHRCAVSPWDHPLFSISVLLCEESWCKSVQITSSFKSVGIWHPCNPSTELWPLSCMNSASELGCTATCYLFCPWKKSAKEKAAVLQ